MAGVYRSLGKPGCALLLGALAAGCSFNSSVAPAQIANAAGASLHASVALDELPTRELTTPKKPLIYWGYYMPSAIAIFSQKGTNPPEQGKITKGLSHPERLFVDKALNLYATNNAKNTITAYKYATTSPYLTISNGVNGPIGVTVDAAGTVYCANIGNSTVTEYPKGQTSPSLTIPMNGLLPEDLAIDASDNLYVSYSSNGAGGGVLEFPHGSTTGKNLGLEYGGGGSLQVDKAGNIIIVDDGLNQIDIYAPGQVVPSKRISVPAGTAFDLTLNQAETQLFVTVELGSATFIVQELDYPNGTSLKNKITAHDGQWEIAVSPDAVL
ncbi:MAG: hypothetical protein JO113_07125 [Candidatus Eremiobacteraeota bacterium]|nr:hypothetical protein [Candidatus Eremiobacteraeota bacterium]